MLFICIFDNLGVNNLGSIKRTNNFPLNTFGHFILVPLNFRDFSEFSQVTKSRRRYNKIYLHEFFINWHILLHEFANIKYTLNQFL